MVSQKYVCVCMVSSFRPFSILLFLVFWNPFQSLPVLLVTVPYFSQRLWRYLIWRVDWHDIGDYEISLFLIGFQHVFCFPLPQAGFQFGVSLQFLGWIYWISIFGFSAVKFNSGQNSTLNTIDPQTPPSSTYKIKGLGIVPQMQIELYIREKNIQVLGHDKTSRLIGSGPIRPSKGQSSVLQAIDHSIAGSLTVQPPGSRPSALRVAAHGQRWSHWVGSYSSSEVQSAYSTSPTDRAKDGSLSLESEWQ